MQSMSQERRNHRPCDGDLHSFGTERIYWTSQWCRKNLTSQIVPIVIGATGEILLLYPRTTIANAPANAKGVDT